MRYDKSYGRKNPRVNDVRFMFVTTVKALMRPTWQLPSGYFVPSNQQEFLSQKQFLHPKWIFKFLKRSLFVWLFVKRCGRVKEVTRVRPEHRSILWINWAAPSLGDSLMDLAPRALLGDRELILLTHQKNAGLYRCDHVFRAVFSCAKELLSQYGKHRFDLVICDAYSPRVLAHKLRVAPFVPFVGLYGFLNGFEVHRTYFAYARMQQLLGLCDNVSLKKIPHLPCTDGLGKEFADLCIAVGGEWKFRTFSSWDRVIQPLLYQGCTVKLVGSKNGTETAALIQSKFPNVRSYVGRLEIGETLREIASSHLFIGCDGGLWHCAVALGKPSVVLFADCQLFDGDGNRVTRETSDMVCETLYADCSVDEIEPSRVTEAIQTMCNRIGLRSRTSVAQIGKKNDE